jgi:hypothetical protein
MMRAKAAAGGRTKEISMSEMFQGSFVIKEFQRNFGGEKE